MSERIIYSTASLTVCAVLGALTAILPMPAVAQHAVDSCSADGSHWDDSCSGGSSAPSSGGAYVAPAPSGPSPAQLAAQRQRAEAVAANERGVKAYNRGDYATAVREFEQASRLAPNDLQINRNYETVKQHLVFGQKQKLTDEAARAATEGDWDSAIRFQSEAVGAARAEGFLDVDWDEADLQLVLGGQALSQGNLTTAARALRAFNQFLRPNWKDAIQVKVLYEADGAADAIERGDLSGALHLYDEIAKLVPHSVYVEGVAAWRKEIARQIALEASNPNYPKPPPVYRDASTPRSYPDLETGTPSQRKAHDDANKDNESGNLSAQTGDWVHALLSYQKALVEDPDGPFAQVLKDNLAIAMKHLGKQGGQSTSATPAASEPASPKPAEEKPKEVVQSNCTGWMAQDGGASFRLCTDDRGQRYCEQADGTGAASRVSCQ